MTRRAEILYRINLDQQIILHRTYRTNSMRKSVILLEIKIFENHTWSILSTIRKKFSMRFNLYEALLYKELQQRRKTSNSCQHDSQIQQKHVQDHRFAQAPSISDCTRFSITLRAEPITGRLCSTSYCITGSSGLVEVNKLRR